LFPYISTFNLIYFFDEAINTLNIMDTEDVPEEYVDLLQTLIKMNVKAKGKNPQEIKAWMKAFVEQDSEDTDIHPDIKPVIHTQGQLAPGILNCGFFQVLPHQNLEKGRQHTICGDMIYFAL
jgi:hypothetical protein